MSIESEIRRIQIEVEGYAREYGLDFFETIFEILEFDELNEVAAYGGFPTRYPHWRFGMEYNQLSKGYAYGLQKIYEMVINNDPCYAYLLKCNHLVDQKIVIAHVYGHCDFFKNNYCFSKTDRKMMDNMANHGTRIRKITERIDQETVENFIDCCLSLDNLIDPHSPFITRASSEDRDYGGGGVFKLRAKEYMDRYINPVEELRKTRERLREERGRKDKFPSESQKDVLLFLLHYAPLAPWQQEILSIVREEAYYFAPQMQTKIMNEGWASYWHSTIMTEKILRDSEVIDYADHHSGTLGQRPGQLNPYKIGIELFRDIEDRWNKGRFGKEWEECDNLYEKQTWDKHLGLGREKIFEVHKIYNDVTFIDTFMTPEFMEAQKLFVYKTNPRTGRMEIASRDTRQVKEGMLYSLTNFGRPYIYVHDANFRNRGELLLEHRWTGLELQLNHAGDTLQNIQKVWQRPVHIATVLNGKRVILSCDGQELKTTEIRETEQEQETVGQADSEG
jgi:stage V sporulation protein R